MVLCMYYVVACVTWFSAINRVQLLELKTPYASEYRGLYYFNKFLSFFFFIFSKFFNFIVLLNIFLNALSFVIHSLNPN